MMNKLHIIEGQIRHYAWGGDHFIPALLGQKTLANQPWAEWWLGAHPDSPSTIMDEGMALSDFLIRHPQLRSAEECRADPTLSFLLKVLDVNQMLAIQVHPSKEQALAGFQREEASGPDRQAFERTYRDANDKPEMMVALTPCWLAHGFAPPERIAARLAQYSAAAPFRSGNISDTFKALLTADVTPLLQEIRYALEDDYHRGELAQTEPEYWICRALFGHQVGYDRGLAILLMLNIVFVPPGFGIYQAAGVPHAYLAGQNIELMANSDNVARIGPTKLHVALPEVLRLTGCSPVCPQLIAPAAIAPAVEKYQHGGSPAFALYRLQPGEAHWQHPHFCIAVVLTGELQAIVASRPQTFFAGQSFIIPAGLAVTFSSTSSLAFIASSGEPYAND